MRTDEVLKQYLSDNARYADLINGMVFDGRQVVQPEDLSDMDSQIITQADESDIGQHKPPRKHKGNRPRYRVLLRRTAFGVNFAVVAVENQSLTHYLMPLRAMDYDIREYWRQAKIIRKQVEAQKDALHTKDCAYPTDTESLTNEEYLSRFRKSDRIHPCVTLVLFYGEEWDGSRDLHGILDFTDIPEEMKPLINNYHINLLEIRKLEQTDMYRTDIRQVFDFIRYSEDKVKLRKLVQQDPAYRHLDSAAYDVVVEFTGATELIAAKDDYLESEDVNMCKALTEMLQDERTLGREEGLEWGIAQGIEQGINQGIEQGIEQGRLITLFALVSKGRLSLSEAADEAQMSATDFETQMLQNS